MNHQTVVGPTPTEHLALDSALAQLQESKTRWARLPIPEKIALLERLKVRIAAAAERWVEAASTAKGLPPGSSLRGEEWVAGPWALLYYLDPLRKTLQCANVGTLDSLVKGRTRQREDGQTIVRVMPDGIYDLLLLSGYEAEIWMQPEVEPEELSRSMAAFYRASAPQGAVALVLGAGNVSFIPLKDVLYKLYAEGQVCLLKMNPVNSYLGPIFEEIFTDFVERGYLRFAYGGADVGQYLTRHAAIEEIHITGSATTHDAIVYGTGEPGEWRKERDEPEISKRVTSELGGVSPVIVVPGPWTDADIRYQAEHVATMKMYNGGFNCIAAQVLVLPSEWSQRGAFLDEVRKALDALPGRPAYYPGAEERSRFACDAHPDGVERLGADGARILLTDVPADRQDHPVFRTELFCGVLAITQIWGGGEDEDPEKYLERAIDFCNTALAGTLSATILIHPHTIRQLGSRLEDGVARLRYGTVGVNVWSAFAFLNPHASWGAYPGHARTDIQSGSGVVNNAMLFERPQKTVVKGPFAPFPRSLSAGEWHTSLKPVWFATNRTADVTAQRLAEFTAAPSMLKLPGILRSAIRG
jgi:aldehyde dehydrogenase (NAD(P)+)